jgi:aminoglycoside phosphotransferase
MRADPVFGIVNDDPLRDNILEQLDHEATPLTQRAARRLRLLQHENRRLRDETLFQAERHQVERLEAGQTIRRLRMALYALDPNHPDAPKVDNVPAKGWWSNE